LTIKQLAETIKITGHQGEIIWDSTKPMVHQKINGYIQNACIGMETQVQLEEFKTYDWFWRI
jgi:GDP-L-fucose synthase